MKSERLRLSSRHDVQRVSAYVEAMCLPSDHVQIARRSLSEVQDQS